MKVSGENRQGRAVGLELTVGGLGFEIYGLDSPAEAHYVHNLADFGIGLVGKRRGDLGRKKCGQDAAEVWHSEERFPDLTSPREE